MKANTLRYAVLYNAGDDDAPDWHTYVCDMDYISCQHFASTLMASGRYAEIEIHRFIVTDEGQKFDAVVPFGSPSDIRDCMIGRMNLLNYTIPDLIDSDQAADLLATGIEIGIMRCVSHVQFTAANSEHDSDLLDDVADDLLAYAPGYQVKWKAISELSQINRMLEAESRSLHSLAKAAQTEFQHWLCTEPKHGILNLPRTRELLDTLNKN